MAKRAAIDTAPGSGTALRLIELEAPVPVEPQVTPPSDDEMPVELPRFVQPLEFCVVGPTRGEVFAGLQVNVPLPLTFRATIQ